MVCNDTNYHGAGVLFVDSPGEPTYNVNRSIKAGTVWSRRALPGSAEQLSDSALLS